MSDATLVIDVVRGSAPTHLVDEVLTAEARTLIAKLHERFEPRRRELLAARTARQERLDAGELPNFLESTREVRDGDWTIAPVPAGLRDRRVEITGPVERKMVINALNSGAKMFMADFEDANSPSWRNCLEGQVNLSDAIRGTIEFTNEAGKEYRLNEEIATLLVRPRGWHLDERHFTVDGAAVSGGIFDVALYVLRNHEALAERGWGPWLYLPKLESHLEARLWNDVFDVLEEELGLERGTIRATVLVETILAAFEMDEILYELRDHAAGLNAGRWDYIFSAIKRLRGADLPVLPDRAQVTMTVPFMKAYAELLVKTCHKRGAHAMGGMAALIPSKRDAEANERALAAVRADKQREASAGFDGTWVAHPDLVPIARAEFDQYLSDDRPNQIDKQRNDVSVTGAELIDLGIPGTAITAKGVRTNVRVGIYYLAAWIAGNGAVAIDNLMEDAATAEISRSQLWQWVQRAATTDDGAVIDAARVDTEIERVVAELRGELASTPAGEHLDDAARIFRQVALDVPFVEFLTLPAYELID